MAPSVLSGHGGLTPEPELLRDNKACDVTVATLFDPRHPGESAVDFLARYATATRICASCPVRELCDVWFATNKLTGIAGGRYHGNVSPDIRRKMR